MSSWLDPPRQRRQKSFCYVDRNLLSSLELALVFPWREKGERKRQTKKKANIFVNFCFSKVGERKTRGKKGKCKRWVCDSYLDEFLTWSSPGTAPEIILLRRQRSFVVSWACVGFSLEEERVIQHRSSKYFPQFENQIGRASCRERV